MAMKKLIALSCMVLAAGLFSGCATYYPVRFNGYVSKEEGLKPPVAGSSIYVKEEENPKNALFSAEVRSKISRILLAKGFQDGSADKADFLLEYSYGISPGIVSGVRPEIQPPEVGTVQSFTETGERRTAYITSPSYTAYVPYRYTVYTSELTLQLLDARAMRGKNRREVVWLGETSTTGQNPDLRETINYLLVTSLDYIGKDTRKSVSRTLARDDPEVLRILQ